MGFFNYYFPIFIVVIIGLTLWNLFEQKRMTRTKGAIQRGVRVWADPISWETRQKLEILPPLTEIEGGFIRKEGREVLIVEKRPGISFGQRRRGIRYVGYINLSDPDSRIEFRTALSSLLIFIFSLMFVLWFFSEFFLSVSRENFSLFYILVPLVFLIMFTGSYFYNHYQERKQIMKLFNRATGDSQITPDSQF